MPSDGGSTGGGDGNGGNNSNGGFGGGSSSSGGGFGSAAASMGYGGIGLGADPSAIGTNPTTTQVGSSALGQGLSMLGGLAFGLPGSIVGGLLGRNMSTTTSDVSGNQTQFNGGASSPMGTGGSMTDTTSWGSTIGSALGGLLGNSLSGGGSNAVNAADPFSSQRPQYQQMLQQLMTNPSSFSESPAAKAAITTGTGQISAQMAQRGLSSSGAEQQALTGYATQTAMSDYYNQISNLMGMSGAGLGTGGAGQIVANQNSANMSGLGALGSQLGSAASSYLGSLSSNVTPQDMTGFFTPSAPISYSPSSVDVSSLGSGAWAPSGDVSTSLTDFFSF